MKQPGLKIYHNKVLLFPVSYVMFPCPGSVGMPPLGPSVKSKLLPWPKIPGLGRGLYFSAYQLLNPLWHKSEVHSRSRI